MATMRTVMGHGASGQKKSIRKYDGAVRSRFSPKTKKRVTIVNQSLTSVFAPRGAFAANPAFP
jgi:hypothetical protein